MAAAVILDFRNFNFSRSDRSRGSNCTSVPNCVKIGWSAAEIWRFLIFQDGGRRHFGFRNFKILTVGTFKRVELHLRAKFCQNRSNRSQDMAIFRFFKMAAAAILDFQNFKFLTAGTGKGVELHQPAKFRKNRLNRGQNMAIFDFSRWRPPPSWMFEIYKF